MKQWQTGTPTPDKKTPYDGPSLRCFMEEPGVEVRLMPDSSGSPTVLEIHGIEPWLSGRTLMICPTGLTEQPECIRVSMPRLQAGQRKYTFHLEPQSKPAT